MTGRISWLAEAAHATGHPVVEVDGWQTRGSADFAPKGLVWHHTAGPATGDLPSLAVMVNGRQDLPGPLYNYGIGRSGTVYVIAAGRANHAGTGNWQGLTGNSTVFGIGAEHVGKPGVAWPKAQVDAFVALSAELCRRAGFDPSMVCGHKEWAPARKVDPISLDMDDMRDAITADIWTGDVMATFKDVPSDHWAADDIDWASERGIITGYTGPNAGRFGPDDVVTRAQMAAIARRIVRLVDKSKA